MSRLVFPDDDKNTEWIAWKKIGKKSAGVEGSRFRWTTEKFCDYNAALPSLNISPLTISLKSNKNVRSSCPRSINPSLLIQLPPFTGSVKTRNTATMLGRARIGKEVISSNNIGNDTLPRANFFVQKQSKSKQNSFRKISRFLKNLDYPRQKVESFSGVRIFGEFNSYDEGEAHKRVLS